MIKQLLDEVRAAPLDERSRDRLRDIYETSVRELGEALSPDLRDELNRLAPPFDGRGAERRRAARREGAAGGVAGGPVPRHPGDAVRPAGGRPPAARADAGPAPAGAGPAHGTRPAAQGPTSERPCYRANHTVVIRRWARDPGKEEFGIGGLVRPPPPAHRVLDARRRGAVAEVIDAAVADGQPAVGITDHGNMYGVLDFYKACPRRGREARDRHGGLHGRRVAIRASDAPRSRR